MHSPTYSSRAARPRRRRCARGPDASPLHLRPRRAPDRAASAVRCRQHALTRLGKRRPCVVGTYTFAHVFDQKHVRMCSTTVIRNTCGKDSGDVSTCANADATTLAPVAPALGCPSAQLPSLVVWRSFMRAEPARTGGCWPTQYGYANLPSCRLVLGPGLSETSTVCEEDDASLRGVLAPAQKRVHLTSGLLPWSGETT